MENKTYAGLGKLLTILFLIVDVVSAGFEICYEDALYYYGCESDDGKECCDNNRACCDIQVDGLSVGAIVGIVIGCIFGLATLIFCCSCALGKGTQVDIDGEAGTVQVIAVQRNPPSYTASTWAYGQSGSANPAIDSDSESNSAFKGAKK